MANKQYAVVDVETTGGLAKRDRITEVAIVVYDGEQIIDQFQSLVNPERAIPYNITQITGITQEMVDEAPRFFEIAKSIVEITQGRVFVAHNARFDYQFIKEEFRRLGYVFTRRQLCTVRLSRQVFPGLRSYSLGKITKHFNIELRNHHRALSDATATTHLLQLILQQQSGGSTAQTLINKGIQASKLPENISLDQLHAIPEECGVYYFHDREGHIIYVGKSINIKTRVMQHFANTKAKGDKIQRYVHDITYEVTGRELIDLLQESHEIKHHHPWINRAQRPQSFDNRIESDMKVRGYHCSDVA